MQKNIERYVYCEQFGISPYPGSYGQQPAKWVDRAFIIKNTLAKKKKFYDLYMPGTKTQVLEVIQLIKQKYKEC